MLVVFYCFNHTSLYGFLLLAVLLVVISLVELTFNEKMEILWNPINRATILKLGNTKVLLSHSVVFVYPIFVTELNLVLIVVEWKWKPVTALNIHFHFYCPI